MNASPRYNCPECASGAFHVEVSRSGDYWHVVHRNGARASSHLSWADAAAECRRIGHGVPEVTS